ncbi:MAG: hypothetical protein Q9223_000032 [Gallowayella weberi]
MAPQPSATSRHAIDADCGRTGVIKTFPPVRCVQRQGQDARLNYLETLLTDHAIPFAPSQEFHLGAKPSPEQPQHQPLSSHAITYTTNVPANSSMGSDASGQSRIASGQRKDDPGDLTDLVSNISMASVRSASDQRYLGSTSGISFARLVFSAVKDSISNGSSEKGFPQATKSAATANGTSVRDSIFGLHSKPSVQPAPFPDRGLGLRLVTLYFSFSNPQIPILHRGDFMGLFERAYATDPSHRSARELYMLNIVFAIGAGIILENSHWGHSPGSRPDHPTSREPASPDAEKLISPSQQHQPEEYHASAMMHLETFLGSTSAIDNPDGFGCGLEELQAVLLLAGFALLRPVAPGLWYITGVATRLGVDLGLHHEDGTNLDESLTFGQQQQDQHQASAGSSEPRGGDSRGISVNERGHREWMRDLRRRLWWCVYSFDRLVSTCVGRPFGITDSVITTDFPAILNDEDITRSGFTVPCESFDGPSYKRVSHHYFRLRLLQSEILQVLQYRLAKQTRTHARKDGNQSHMHTHLSPSFLQPFDSFKAWRQDIDRRLSEWKDSAPLQEDTTVQFDVRFLELNYWQVVIMLYRQSLGLVARDASLNMDLDDDVEDENVHLKIAEAGQRVLILYRQLHRIHLVNYTHRFSVRFVAFECCSQSPGEMPPRAVASRAFIDGKQTLDDVDFTVLAATSVLGDLIDKCPPAEACRDAFERMSRATVKMCLSTTGFGSEATGASDGHRQYEHSAATKSSTPRLNEHELQLPPLHYDTSHGQQAHHDGQGGHGWSGELGRWQAIAETVGTPLNQANKMSASDGDPDQRIEGVAGNRSLTPPVSMLLGSHKTIDGSYDAGAMTDSEMLLESNDLGFDTDFGTNLGFGNEHDWSDGLQLDLFDGFFFGGSNVGSVATVNKLPRKRASPQSLDRTRSRPSGPLRATQFVIENHPQLGSQHGAAMAPLPATPIETKPSHLLHLRYLLPSRSSLDPRNVIKHASPPLQSKPRVYSIQPLTDSLNSLARRQQAPPKLIPETYAGLNKGPPPGTVVGIVLGSVAGFLLILWLIYTCVNFNATRAVSTYDEETIVRRRSRSPRSSRRSPSRHAPSRSRSRSEVIEVSRHRSPPRRETRRETVIMEERSRPPPPPVEREDDIVEVIEEHSPVRRSSGSRRVSGYRTVDPEAYGGGNRPLRKVSRR